MIDGRKFVDEDRSMGPKKGAIKAARLAHVTAKAIEFPADIEIVYRSIDDQLRMTGEEYRGYHLVWDEVRRRYGISASSAMKYEELFSRGEPAFIGNHPVIFDIVE